MEPQLALSQRSSDLDNEGDRYLAITKGTWGRARNIHHMGSRELGERAERNGSVIRRSGGEERTRVRTGTRTGSGTSTRCWPATTATARADTAGTRTERVISSQSDRSVSPQLAIPSCSRYLLLPYNISAIFVPSSSSVNSCISTLPSGVLFALHFTLILAPPLASARPTY
jgi:hypothetical protein